jgi:hypothetical protein
VLTGYDSVSVPALPAGGDFYLAYIDGYYANYIECKSRFPNTPVLSVTTGGFHAANLCDCEYGDYNPQQAADGLHRGLWRGIYSSTSQYNSIRQAVGHDFPWFSAEVPLKNIKWPHITPGAIATQWAWPGHGSPGNYDISSATTLAPFFSSPPPPPIPVPSLPTFSEEDMIQTTHIGTQTHIYVFNTATNNVTHFWQDSAPADPAITDKWFTEPVGKAS